MRASLHAITLSWLVGYGVAQFTGQTTDSQASQSAFICGTPRIADVRITAEQQVELEVYAPPPPPDNVDRYVFELLFGTQAIANSKRDGTTAWQPLDLLFDPANARGYAPSSCGQTFYDRAISQERTYSTYADPDTDLPLPALDFACNDSSLITWRTTTPSARAIGNREINSDCVLGGMSWRLTVDLDRYLQNQEAMGVTKEYVNTGVLYNFPVVITEEVVKKVNGRSMVRTMQQHFRLFSQNNVMVSLAVRDESIDSFNTFSVTDLTTERILTSSSTNTFKTRFNITSFVLGPSAARRRRDLLAAPPTALVLDQSPQFRTAVLTYDDEGDADQAYYFIPATPDSMGAYEPVSSVNCNHVYGSDGFSEAAATDASLVPGDFDNDYTGTFYSQSAVMVCVYHVGAMQNGVIAPLPPDVEVDFDMSVRYEYRFLETDGSIVSDPLKQPYLEHIVKAVIPALTAVELEVPLEMTMHVIASDAISAQIIDYDRWQPAFVMDALRDVGKSGGPAMIRATSENTPVATYITMREASDRASYDIDVLFSAVMARAASKQYLEYTRADSSSEFNLTNDDLIEDVCQLRQAADAGSLLGFSVMHYDPSIADEVGLHPTLKAYINGQRAAIASLRSPSSFFKVNDELDRDGPLLMNHNLESATGPKNAFVQPLLPNFGLGSGVARDEYRISVCAVTMLRPVAGSQRRRMLLQTTRNTRARRGVGDEQLFFTLLPRDLNYQVSVGAGEETLTIDVEGDRSYDTAPSSSSTTPPPTSPLDSDKEPPPSYTETQHEYSYTTGGQSVRDSTTIMVSTLVGIPLLALDIYMSIAIAKHNKDMTKNPTSKPTKSPAAQMATNCRNRMASSNKLVI
ncbi:hypothetical protein CYMTET_40320 [Cymbomonas tetramitiformis]|uniref:Uncharacterized protein n=1 Tax=Cymbomonas tetramitiformis TaxID=36881 RepID=A0AAE0F4Q2_9CHLO|nr:hypothetical protein CYMTET_40320 [Cymbomonas tetramitiformis]